MRVGSPLGEVGGLLMEFFREVLHHLVPLISAALRHFAFTQAYTLACTRTHKLPQHAVANIDALRGSCSSRGRMSHAVAVNVAASRPFSR
mmetsp:Transcript_43435/g.93047  ORF Transcript_43435/g.93047 Transcript_43435/m.93047 type:complete len:90 (+) Transcript_43435:136-405(+)